MRNMNRNILKIQLFFTLTSQYLMFTDKENVGYFVNCLYNDRNSRYIFQGKK